MFAQNLLATSIAAFYQPILSKINPFNLGKKSRMLEIGEKYAWRILGFYNKNLTESRIRDLVDFLVNRCPEHGYVVDYNMMSLFLDNVMLTKEVSEEYQELVSALSTEFMKGEQTPDFVGFVDSCQTKSDDIGSVENSGQKNIDFSHKEDYNKNIALMPKKQSQSKSKNEDKK